MTDVSITHIGGPTTLIEAAGWRLLTDPTFDKPGRRYSFGWGAFSRKLTGPALSVDEVGPIDAILLSHDHHGDNLDDAGRAMLSDAGTVITTIGGAKRLAGNARGLEPWATTRLEGVGRLSIDVTATPCRHGPRFSRPIAGEVVGFSMRWDGQEHGELWMSGDTVLYEGVRQVTERIDVGTAVLHLGGVQFPVTGPVRYSMTARDAIELCELLRPHTAIPVHYEGWQHFRQGRAEIEQDFGDAPAMVRDGVRWLSMGTPATLTV